MAKLKKISWRKAKGGRAMEHLLEGWYNNVHIFTIEGGLCVTDLRPIRGDEWKPVKSYSISSRKNAKKIASDLLNDLNVEEHQKNWQDGEDRSARTIKIIEDAQRLIDKYTTKENG